MMVGARPVTHHGPTLIVMTAVLMVIPMFLISDWITDDYINPQSLLYIVIAGPLIEETMRNLSARWTGLWNANTRTALMVGFLIGALEMCFKAYIYGRGVAFDMRSLLNVISWSSSLPIHAALSLVFYSLRGDFWRWPIMIGIHAVLNATSQAIAYLLWGQVSIPVFAVITLAAVTAVCALVGWAAQQRRA